MKIREAMGSDDYPQLVFKKVFVDDINRLLTWEDIWKKRTPPKPLTYDILENGVVDGETEPQSSNSVALEDQRVWSLKENFNVFFDRCAHCYLKVFFSSLSMSLNFSCFNKSSTAERTSIAGECERSKRNLIF
jgi:hypothetical protein